MALKMDRQIDATELGYFVNTVQERGYVLSETTYGSGIALDSPSNVAIAATVASGSRPLGILLNDFVNLDLTRQPLNWHKDQAQIGNKATILTKGWVVTNAITAGLTVKAGDDAILDVSGLIKNVSPGLNLNYVANPKIGRFRSSVDENGYARIYVDL